MAEHKPMGELSHTEPSGIAAASMCVKQHKGILIYMFKKNKNASGQLNSQRSTQTSIFNANRNLAVLAILTSRIYNMPCFPSAFPSPM